MEYNNHDDYYKDDLDLETLKLLNKVCEGVEVPDEDAANEAALAHGDKEDDECSD